MSATTDLRPGDSIRWWDGLRYRPGTVLSLRWEGQYPGEPEIIACVRLERPVSVCRGLPVESLERPATASALVVAS